LKKLRSVIPPQREDHIKDLANTIAKDHISGHSVVLDGILEENGIMLYYDDFDESFDGLLDYDDGVFSIFCNTKTGNTPVSVRSRFTIAHELGHYFIDEHRKALMQHQMPSVGDYASEDLIIEREADLFASYLLLPPNVFTGLGVGGAQGDVLAKISKIADIHNVSVKCVAIRFVSIDLVSCSLAFWSPKGDLIWKWFSKSMWDAGIRNLKLVPVKGSATDKCIARFGEKAFKECSAGPVGYLFGVADGAHYSEIIHEESMVLGEYGVLTLFYSNSGKLKSMASILNERLERKREL